ncbi:hypothetical protein TELCIR_03019 [Teladorsagia circumcincta]|uniref:Uncharacterized protein n=1 Tax=Teladorsagia circumcincta TaxID=45464 RepID=A0A2G9UZ01_TELCI|nr:hypothetical protein TELCIR_03019 [Teladorsagia circumcincta]
MRETMAVKMMTRITLKLMKNQRITKTSRRVQTLLRIKRKMKPKKQRKRFPLLWRHVNLLL